MKKSIVFVVFCTIGFCIGYLAGVPFSMSPIKTLVVPTRSGAKCLNEQETQFVSLTDSRASKGIAVGVQKPRSQSTFAANPASGIDKLTLAEVQARLQQMNGMQATSVTDEQEQNLVARWAKLDPMGAAEFAADAVAQGGNPRLIQMAANAWAKNDPVGASQWAASLESPLARDSALGQIFNTWSLKNPTQAASAIATLPMGSAQTVATSAVAKNFANGNLNAALQWAQGLSGPVKLAATREIVNLWSSSDPEATGAWVMQQGSPQVRSDALRQLAGNWVFRDPGAAIEYGQTIADAGLRKSFIESAMQRFTNMDPVSAANWLSSDAAKPHASSLVGNVSSRWAAFDPDSAAGWATSITDPTLRNKALSAVSRSWGETDPAKAAQWINSLKDVQTRDVATAAFSVELAKENPATAVQWASHISDPTKLNNSINQIVNNWKKMDPNAARSFVLSSPSMPPDLRARLLK
jgi:hypothetical protein